MIKTSLLTRLLKNWAQKLILIEDYEIYYNNDISKLNKEISNI